MGIFRKTKKITKNIEEKKELQYLKQFYESIENFEKIFEENMIIYQNQVIDTESERNRRNANRTLTGKWTLFVKIIERYKIVFRKINPEILNSFNNATKDIRKEDIQILSNFNEHLNYIQIISKLLSKIQNTKENIKILIEKNS